MMKLYGFLILSLCFLGCKTTASMSGSLQSDDTSSHLAPQTLALWNDYVARETKDASIQPDCMPRIIEAAAGTEPRGTVMFFHGFTACPQQYFDIGQKLAAQGFDVFLPLMPGHGRTFSRNPGPGEYYRALPTEKEQLRYPNFVSSMNNIISTTTQPRVITGLSGGGSLATGAVVTGPDIWDRAIFYSAYYMNPPIEGALSTVIDFFDPDYVNDWGEKCRQNMFRPGGRAGLCSLEVTAIRAMTRYGYEIARSAHLIQIPVQFAGVESDTTAWDTEILKVQKTVQKSQVCLYPKGVPHSLINPKADAPELTPYWVPSLQEDSINFIMNATFFPTVPANGKAYAICRHDVSP